MIYGPWPRPIVHTYPLLLSFLRTGGSPNIRSPKSVFYLSIPVFLYATNVYHCLLSALLWSVTDPTSAKSTPSVPSEGLLHHKLDSRLIVLPRLLLPLPVRSVSLVIHVSRTLYKSPVLLLVGPISSVLTLWPSSSTITLRRGLNGV